MALISRDKILASRNENFYILKRKINNWNLNVEPYAIQWWKHLKFFHKNGTVIHFCNSQNFMLTVETHSFKVTTSSVQRCFEICSKIRCHAERQCQRTFGKFTVECRKRTTIVRVFLISMYFCRHD